MFNDAVLCFQYAFVEADVNDAVLCFQCGLVEEDV